VGGAYLAAGANPAGVAAQGGATFSFADVLAIGTWRRPFSLAAV
jgi:hypothetical protein